jgi:phosphoribosylanthranilate isomerase
MVKVCGLTNLQDAQAAVDAGADMLGFIFYSKSPRATNPEVVRDIVAHLSIHSKTPLKIGVFVNEKLETAHHLLDYCKLDAAQLHGEESPEMLGLGKGIPSPSGLNGDAYKAIRPSSREEAYVLAEKYALSSSMRNKHGLPALLVDSYHPKLHGGTGKTGDWQMAATLANQYPILLAGGLDPTNVENAIRIVKPWGVDVASGVEDSPGVKNISQMQAFLKSVKKTNLKV